MFLDRVQSAFLLPEEAIVDPESFTESPSPSSGPNNYPVETTQCMNPVSAPTGLFCVSACFICQRQCTDRQQKGKSYKQSKWSGGGVHEEHTKQWQHLHNVRKAEKKNCAVLCNKCAWVVLEHLECKPNVHMCLHSFTCKVQMIWKQILTDQIWLPWWILHSHAICVWHVNPIFHM